jgi:hypothetical protein
VRESRLDFFVVGRQRRPQLQAMGRARLATQIVGRALRVNDAAPGRHPVDRAGLDALHRPGGIAMLHRAFEQVGHRRQADVRMRPHIVVVAGLRGHRAEMIEEQERPDRLALRRRQQPADDEAAAEVLGVALKRESGVHGQCPVPVRVSVGP